MKAGVPVVIRAEQALLGAVTSGPDGQAHVLDLMDPDDMTRPYHGQVLAAMQRLRGSGTAPGPLAVYAEIKRDPDLPPRVSHDGVLLAGLMEAPPRPGHASACAAILAGDGIRRQIAVAASRMIQATEGLDLETALSMAGQAKRELERCQARWDALPEPIGREPPVTDVVDLAASGADLRSRQARAGAEAGTCPGPAADEAGTRILRDLAAGPSQITAVSACGRSARPGPAMKRSPRQPESPP
jgi:hypothetical protein